jgi:hypothetical protein
VRAALRERYKRLEDVMPYDANDWAEWAEPTAAELAALDESPLAALFGPGPQTDPEADLGGASWDALDELQEEQQRLAAELARQTAMLEHTVAEVGQLLDELLDAPALRPGSAPLVRLEELRDCLLLALEGELEELELGVPSGD